VVTNGIHADLCLPLAQLPPDLRALVPDDDFEPDGATYAEFGWGDRGFFLETPTWADLRFSVAAKALFWPSPSAIHVSRMGYAPDVGDSAVALDLSPEQFVTLAGFVARSFEVGGEGGSVAIENAGYEGWNDRFYVGKGSYTIFYTCNNWTAEALEEAGVRAPIWAPFDGAIFRQLREVAAKSPPI
jgi:uncharacterized protein (TIGR02117 family)